MNATVFSVYILFLNFYSIASRFVYFQLSYFKRSQG